MSHQEEPTARELYLNDPERLAELARTGLPDSGPEPSFDRLTRLASSVLGTPVALVSLVDDHRQYFKSCVGLPEPWASRRETPLTHSFCQHVVTTRKPLVIEDARVNPLVRENMAVSDLGVVAYLGIPLEVLGHVIGSFCAIDGVPRKWTTREVEMLGDLAESVVSEIRLRADREELDRQRLAAEEARRFAQISLSSIGEAVIATDVGGLITFLNPVAERLGGITSAEASGRALEAVFPIVDEETREAVSDPVRAMLGAGENFRAASRLLLLARDGRETAIEGGASPIRGADGEAEGAILVLRDVTAKRRSETALRDAKLRLDNALSAGSVATWTWDVRNDRVMADVNLARLFSVSPEDARGGKLSSYLRAIHPEDRVRVGRVIGEAIAAGIGFDEEYRIVQGDGSIRWVVARGDMERGAGGEALSHSGVVVDITDRKEGEQKLRRSKERYRSLFETMEEGFCVVEMIRDAEGKALDYRFLEVNPAFEGLTGLKDAMGKRVKELALDHDQRWIETYGEVAKTGRAVRFSSEASALDGRYFDGHAFRFGDPGSGNVAILFNDVTDRRRAEEERERLLIELREADRRKDEFLAMLAHELRNPLAAISSGVMLVKTMPTPEVLDQIKDMIDRQTKHLTHLIDDLLDVSRIATGKVVLRKGTVELGQIIARAVDQVRPVIEAKGHELRIRQPDEPVLMEADPTRGEQILGNLLTNAAKYTSGGGRIDLDAKREGDEVVVSVRDNGVGIPAEMLPQVFGLFTQIDSSLERSQGGLGIGLTLVRSLVEMHGGQVSAASDGEGKGSTFTVRMPIGKPSRDLPKSPLKTTAAEPIGPVRAIRRILIVDDNRDTAKMTGRLLRHLGFEVRSAYDGHEAVEAAREFRPHVLLLDIGLPGMNGYEVASVLRDDPCCVDAVFIAVSGYGESKALDRSREAGFHHHLTKPLDFDQLDAILKGVGRREALTGSQETA